MNVQCFMCDAPVCAGLRMSCCSTASPDSTHSQKHTDTQQRTQMACSHLLGSYSARLCLPARCCTGTNSEQDVQQKIIRLCPINSNAAMLPTPARVVQYEAVLAQAAAVAGQAGKANEASQRSRRAGPLQHVPVLLH
jgi:hypothetical protein